MNYYLIQIKYHPDEEYLKARKLNLSTKQRI